MRHSALIVFVAAALTAGLSGCLEREMTITSEPSGALVTVSDIEIGRTPVTIPFTWYGDYDVILRMDGYETLKTHGDLNAPWYAYPPVDLLATLWPGTITDSRYLHYELQEYQAPSPEQLIDRARQLRERNEQPAD